MVSRRAVLLLALAQLIALGVLAQSSAEFARATGGEIALTPKGTAPLSGSLEISMSSDVFGGSSTGYGVTGGGTLLQDRLWFFASASQQDGSRARFANLELPENATTGAIGARVNGQLGDAHNFAAFFEAARRPELTSISPMTFDVVPSSFLSLRYNAQVSSNMLFSASFTRRSATTPAIGIAPIE